MPATGKIYPDWVQAQRARGTTVKKKGDTYYLYKRTSRRVPGKKYPQPVDTYIGVITPDGVVESGKRKISLAGIEVKEYGFSRAVWQLCPEGWKRPLGEDWEDVLSIIVRKWSPETYLMKERAIKEEREFHYQFAAQASSLSRRIFYGYNSTNQNLLLWANRFLGSHRFPDIPTTEPKMDSIAMPGRILHHRHQAEPVLH